MKNVYHKAVKHAISKTFNYPKTIYILCKPSWTFIVGKTSFGWYKMFTKTSILIITNITYYHDLKHVFSEK